MSKRPHSSSIDDGPDKKKGKLDALASIEAKKAEVMAKIAAMSARNSSSSTPAIQKDKNDMGWTPDQRQHPISTPLDKGEEIRRLVEEKKRKVAEAHSRVGNLAALARKNNLYNANSGAPVAREEGGLNMAAHPLLLDSASPASKEQSKKDRYKPMLPKFSTVKANVRNAPSPMPGATAPLTRSGTGTPKPTNPYLR